MDFIHPAQHSIANLAQLEKEGGSDLTPSKAVYYATQLVSHAHPGAQDLINLLRNHSRHPDLLSYVDIVEKCYINVRKTFKLENLPDEQRALFYKTDGITYIKRRIKSDKLLVIFATMFNNFHFSHATMASILTKLDCNILILRDSTLFNYHKGVVDFAESLPEIGPAITRLAQRDGVQKIYITGFSSCGYAALYTALNSDCHGYLGFSHPIDMRADSPLKPPPYFTQKVREAVDATYLIDLKEQLRSAGSGTPRTLVYGERSQTDALHGRYVADLPNLNVIALAGVAHSTLEYLHQDDQLLDLFARLIAD